MTATTRPPTAPTGGLTTAPHFDDGDGFYEALIQAHQGLADDESHAYNARLVLVLANHIGAHRVLLQALEAARLPPAGWPADAPAPRPDMPDMPDRSAPSEAPNGCKP